MRIDAIEGIGRELIKGAYDLHVHSAPSHFKRSLDDFELAREASAFGMAGIMIKNHYEPTETRATIANRYSGAATKMYGGIVLNWPVGGINPYAAESCLSLGGSIVWMPTRDAANSLNFGDMPGDFFKRKGITIYDKDGNILRTVYEVLEIVRAHNAAIATGHLSTKESYDLCMAAVKMNTKVILTHPDWFRTIAPLELQMELASIGVYIEKSWSNVKEGTITDVSMADSIMKIGCEHIFLVTDRGQADQIKPVAEYIDCLVTLHNLGIGEKQIKTMSRYNPMKIINANQ